MRRLLQANPIGQLVVYEHGELFHVGCRSRTTQLRSIEAVDRAHTVKQRAVYLIDDAKQGQAARQGQTGTDDRQLGACPFCVHSAIMTDWRPGAEWIAVEDCPCGGYFVWAP